MKVSIKVPYHNCRTNKNVTAKVVVEIPGEVAQGERELWGFLIKAEGMMKETMKERYGRTVTPVLPDDADPDGEDEDE